MAHDRPLFDLRTVHVDPRPSTLDLTQTNEYLALNTVAMRNAELTSGIEVYSDETGEVYGSSQAAAKEAIGLTVISRVVIAAGCLLAPPLVTTMMERRKFQSIQL